MISISSQYTTIRSMAGQKFRQSLGRDRSGNKDGPIHDMDDFYFADGRPAPETSKQKKWKNQRKSDEERILACFEDFDEANDRGNLQQFY